MTGQYVCCANTPVRWSEFWCTQRQLYKISDLLSAHRVQRLVGHVTTASLNAINKQSKVRGSINSCLFPVRILDALIKVLQAGCATVCVTGGKLLLCKHVSLPLFFRGHIRSSYKMLARPANQFAPALGLSQGVGGNGSQPQWNVMIHYGQIAASEL